MNSKFWIFVGLHLILIAAILGIGRAFADDPDLIEVRWKESGYARSLALDTRNVWVSSGATTTVFWTGNPATTTRVFSFKPDADLWLVGTRQDGDLNWDGSVNIFDVILLMQRIVGIE